MSRIVSWLSDRFGRAVPKPEKAAVSVAALPASVRDRADLVDPLSSLTPAKLKAIFQAADDGDLGPQIELAETIEERDPQIQSLIEIRKLAVTSLRWNIQPGEDSDQGRERAAEFAAVWDQLDAMGLIGYLSGAVFRQWAIAQIMWDTRGRWTPRRWIEVDGRRMAWPASDATQADQGGPEVPYLTADWGSLQRVEIRPGSFVTHAHRATSRPGRGAMVRAVAFWWLVARFAAIDLSTLLEQFGRPWRSVKYDPNATSDQIRTILQTLKSAAADLCIAIPSSSELQFHAGLAQADAPHIAVIRLAHDCMAKAIIGSTTINDAAANNDNVSSPTHAAVRKTLRNADALALAETLNRDLLRPWSAWNYGEGTPAPKIAPVLDDDPEPATRSQVFIAARRDLRLRLMADQVYSELGLTMPPETPEILEPSAEPSGFFPPRASDPNPPQPQPQPDHPEPDADDDEPDQPEEVPN